MKTNKIALFIIFLSFIPLGAGAQTSLPPKPGQNANYPSAPPPTRSNLPPSSTNQAKQHIQGVFPTMTRTLAGGLIQEAWDKSDQSEGVVRFSQCRDCVYKVRLREFMISAIELPNHEIITAIDIGDGQAFEVKQRNAFTLAIVPRGFGMDSDLIIYTKSGMIYPFYLRAEAHNSQNIPDLVVKIGAAGMDKAVATLPVPAINDKITTEEKTKPPPAFMTNVIDGFSYQEDEKKENSDFINRAEFDPSKLRGFTDYSLWGNEGGKAMKPDRIFRDDQFTYIQFGDKWNDIELPTAYVVIDDIDELVNTRVIGQTYIIESTNSLITLKSGKSYLCIKYEGEA